MIQIAFVAVIAMASATKKPSKNAVHPIHGETVVENNAQNGNDANQPNAPTLQRVRRVDRRNDAPGAPEIHRQILRIDQVTDNEID